MAASCKAVIFKEVPTEFPVPGQHLATVDTHKDINTEIGPGEVLVKVLFISLDPYMRGRMRPAEVKSYEPAFTLGQPFSGHGIGEVVKSNNPDFPVGVKVVSLLAWETYTVIKQNNWFATTKITEIEGIPLSNWIGVLGMPGMTAFVGLHKIGNPKVGETIFISAASGAVGQLVGQLAKGLGLRVVGSAGEDSKVEYLVKELKFDAAFNYKTCDMNAELTKHCPKGIDIYFENVGGKTLEVVLTHCNNFARIVVCGMISQYNTQKPEGIHNLFLLIVKRIRMEGFIVSDDWATYWPQFVKEIPELIKKGEIKYKEDIAEGLEKAPEAFVGMLKGHNLGKAIVKV